MAHRGARARAGDHERVVAAMRRAIELSARGLGRVSPNPAVGCVILDVDGRVAGEGWHARAGGPHAEVAALADARSARAGEVVVDRDREIDDNLTQGESVVGRAAGRTGECRQVGETAVVTLEPCPHTGRTGPCTDALLHAGISRVVYAVADPSHGGGGEVLRQAGVEVHGPSSALVPAELTEAATTSTNPG